MTISTYDKGLRAEAYARSFLEKKGYMCLSERYRSPYGEIDLVMLDHNTLVAIEVKFRKNEADGYFSITPKQQKRIQNALLSFQNEHFMYRDSFLRLDVVLISPLKPLIHIENAWQVDDDENSYP